MDHRTEMLQDKAHTDVAFRGPAKGRETAGGLATVWPLRGPRPARFCRPSVKVIEWSDGDHIISGLCCSICENMVCMTNVSTTSSYNLPVGTSRYRFGRIKLVQTTFSSTITIQTFLRKWSTVLINHGRIITYYLAF